MRSNDQLKTSELKVLKSAAGYYIGRQYFDIEINGWLPYSRESQEYYQTEYQASAALVNNSYTVKTTP